MTHKVKREGSLLVIDANISACGNSIVCSEDNGCAVARVFVTDSSFKAAGFVKENIVASEHISAYECDEGIFNVRGEIVRNSSVGGGEILKDVFDGGGAYRVLYNVKGGIIFSPEGLIAYTVISRKDKLCHFTLGVGKEGNCSAVIFLRKL